MRYAKSGLGLAALVIGFVFGVNAYADSSYRTGDLVGTDCSVIQAQEDQMNSISCEPGQKFMPAKACWDSISVSSSKPSELTGCLAASVWSTTQVGVLLSKNLQSVTCSGIFSGPVADDNGNLQFRCNAPAASASP